jgi:hypothetical protein
MPTTNNSYKMHSPGLAESHPSILRGDRILNCISGGGDISKFEGMGYCACQENVIMVIPIPFGRDHADGLLVDVRFNFSQTTVHTSPQALVNNQVRQSGGGTKSDGTSQSTIINNQARQSGRRTKSDGTSQSTINTMKNGGQHDLTMQLLHRNFVHVVRDHPVACASLYHHLLNQHEGFTNKGRICTILTQKDGWATLPVFLCQGVCWQSQCDGKSNTICRGIDQSRR